jgi:hypothetical protein
MSHRQSQIRDTQPTISIHGGTFYFLDLPYLAQLHKKIGIGLLFDF